MRTPRKPPVIQMLDEERDRRLLEEWHRGRISVEERIAEALERIADALEKRNLK